MALHVLRIVHLGTSGSFSEEAALRHAAELGRGAELVPAPSPEVVLAELERCGAERAVLPIANARAGLVTASLEALAGRELELLAEVTLDVRLHLWVRSAAIVPARVRRVASHPHALRQCAQGLARLLPGRESLPMGDTATAARELARGAMGEDTAVLASSRAGEIHGLHPLARDVHDDPGNRTFFVVLGRPARKRVE